MKNFDEAIVNLVDGENLLYNDKPLTFRTAAIYALTTQRRDEQPNQEESLKRYDLALRISKGGDVDISHEEITKIGNLTAKTWPPAISGPMSLLLKD